MNIRAGEDMEKALETTVLLARKLFERNGIRTAIISRSLDRKELDRIIGSMELDTFRPLILDLSRSEMDARTIARTLMELHDEKGCRHVLVLLSRDEPLDEWKKAAWVLEGRMMMDILVPEDQDDEH